MITEKKINDWISRKKIPIYEKYKERTNTWNNFKKELDFKYYRCDFCGSAIVIRKDNSQQDGGEFDLPVTRLKRGTARVVVHNICLNKFLKELDIFWEEREKK